MGKPEEKETTSCAVCGQEKTVEVTLTRPDANGANAVIKLCGRPCLSAYKFGNAVDAFTCGLCSKDFDVRSVEKGDRKPVVRDYRVLMEGNFD